MSKDVNNNPQRKSKSKKINMDKFTYTKEEVDSLKFYSSKEEIEQEDKKAGRKTIWY